MGTHFSFHRHLIELVSSLKVRVSKKRHEVGLGDVPVLRMFGVKLPDYSRVCAEIQPGVSRLGFFVRRQVPKVYYGAVFRVQKGNSDVDRKEGGT